MIAPRTHWDVVIAGARCAGATTAMLLARSGLRVLVVDPARPGSDTLSTHALMRGAVEQLHGWGLLGAIRAGGTPAIRTTTFQYGVDEVTIEIGMRNGVDALYAPRRTLLDSVLQDAARASGAHLVHGAAVIDLTFEDGGTVDAGRRWENGRAADGGRRVTGAVVSTVDGATTRVSAPLVIGADGIRSRIARLVGAPVDHRASHATSTVYGYWPDPGLGGYRWHYRPGVAVGAIPTNQDLVCVFASISPAAFHERGAVPLGELHRRLLAVGAPELLDALPPSAGAAPHRFRAFAGLPGFLRQSAGPGWALVGDAGYYRDPLTAHGITDALRDASLLARAVVAALGGAGEDEIATYQKTRDAQVLPFLELSDRIASFDWDLDSIRALHLDMSRQMNRLAAFARAANGSPGADEILAAGAPLTPR